MTEEIEITQIKHISEIHDWFQLKKYDFTKKLDAAGWYEQLLVRFASHSAMSRLKEGSGDEEDTDLIEHINDKIQENPIISILTDDILSRELSDNTLEELLQKKPHCTLGVHKLTVDEFLRIEHIIEKPLEQMRNQWKKYIFNPNKLDSDNDATPLGKWIDKPLYQLHYHEVEPLHEVLHINWELPDTILIEHFKQFLKSQRPKNSVMEEGDLLKEYQKKCYRKPDFRTWNRLGILPYLDLKLLAFELDANIPYRVMADAIYPLGIYGEETVRKTTAPLAEILLSETALNALAQYAALKIAEQPRN